NKISFEKAKENRYNNEVRCPDPDIAEKMKESIMDVKKSGNSLGGIVECVSIGLPVGLGEPVFSSLESDLSKALFSIPAVKAIEFGSGFEGTKKTGYENNDLFIKEEGKVITLTNNSGGILGGISNGMPLTIRIGFKPAASIAKIQRTLDFSSDSLIDLQVPGRHDPCVVPRAPPIIEGIVSIILSDHAIKAGFIPNVLRGY
ncbi:MAG: chorismate synthase, partial [Nitrososphaerales archaeon]